LRYASSKLPCSDKTAFLEAQFFCLKSFVNDHLWSFTNDLRDKKNVSFLKKAVLSKQGSNASSVVSENITLFTD